MPRTIQEIVKEKVEDPNLRTTGLGPIGIFIAGPIDEDYHPKVNNHHWEVATLSPVILLGLVIDLDCCQVINEELKKVRDCHGWLSLNTRDKEHTLGVLVVVPERGPVNIWTPLEVTNLRSGSGYLPVAVTFIGRNRQSGYKNVITQWHQELLKFVIGGGPS